MSNSEKLLTLFTAQIESRNGSSTITVPERELETGDLEEGAIYRVAILPQVEQQESSTGRSASSAQRAHQETTGRNDTQSQNAPVPPVTEGDTLEVEIEDTGDQGDGIARIGPGYIVFVPGTTPGDRVKIEIEQARDRFAFAEVLEDEPITG